AATVTADFQHRVHDEVNGELGSLEDDAQRVDQKRHIVRHGHYERVRRVETIALRIRIEDADERLARGALHAELEMVERHASQQARGAFGQVFFTDTAEVGFYETLLHVRKGSALAAALTCSGN